MREIKFRVWDYHSNKYIKDYITGTSLSLNDLFKNGSIVNGKNSLAFEQYTGLKDCNGVEIYEGDVVVKKNYDTTLRIVRYDEKSCCFEFLTKKEKNKITNRGEIDSITVNSCCWHKVIGNIYENPELLEV